jgi:hypothetical protein
MAELTSIKMSKFDNQPWGFRLQGGIDFCAPLTVQKVSYDGGGCSLILIFQNLIYFEKKKELKGIIISKMAASRELSKRVKCM